MESRRYEPPAESTPDELARVLAGGDTLAINRATLGAAFTWPDAQSDVLEATGACVATRNVMEMRGRVRWLVRQQPQAPEDSGWRVFSEFDDDDYVNDPANSQVVDYNSVCAIEPAVIAVYPLPVGSDVEIRHDGGRVRVHDSTGRDITDELMERGRP